MASRRAGFGCIEDMLARDYGAFEALADKWREGNPAAALLSAGGGRVDPYIRAVQAWKADFMRVASCKAPVDGAINMPMPTVLVGMGVR